jgi:hypothetical protein
MNHISKWHVRATNLPWPEGPPVSHDNTGLSSWPQPLSPKDEGPLRWTSKSHSNQPTPQSTWAPGKKMIMIRKHSHYILFAIIQEDDGDPCPGWKTWNWSFIRMTLLTYALISDAQRWRSVDRNGEMSLDQGWQSSRPWWERCPVPGWPWDSDYRGPCPDDTLIMY